MAARVVDPYQREWFIQRRWVPRAPKWLGPRPDVPEADAHNARRERRWRERAQTTTPSAESDLVIPALLLAVGAILLLGAVVIFFIDFLLLAIVLVFGVLAKIVFRRPWIIDATTSDPPAAHHTEEVVGWRASGEAIERLARALEASGSPAGGRNAAGGIS